MSSTQDNRKLLAILSHISPFSGMLIPFGNIVGPLIFLLAVNDDVVKKHARESLNFQISLFIYGIVSSILIFVLIGIPLVAAVAIAFFVCPIIGAIKAADNQNSVWRYPLTIRFLKDEDAADGKVVDAVAEEKKAE